MIISIKNNWEKAIDIHNHYLNNIICNYLASKDNSPKVSIIKNFINDTHHLLILAQKVDILESIKIYESYTRRLKKHTRTLKFFNTELKKIFNYDRFIRKSIAWNAYELCKKSITRTCPYCNQAFAFTIQKKNRGFRPTLDHFYSKDIYPHLSLVINNLIPSCSTCNSSLKGMKNFHKDEHLNPLWDEEAIKFDLIHEDGILKLEEGMITSPEKIKMNINFDSSNASIKNSVITFLLKERYEEMIIEAIEFATAKLNCDYAISTGIPYFNSKIESSLIRFNKEEYKRYLLGKLFLDIYNNVEISKHK